jgi:hypothetical protein
MNRLARRIMQTSVIAMLQPGMAVSCEAPNGSHYCVWAGVDSVWEQKKLKATKMLVNCADSPPSAALSR